MALSQLALNVSPATPPVAQLESLSMGWGGTMVLDRVDLSLTPGERLVVVGPSGAGKSTLLRLLAGLQLPTDGRLFIHGEPQTYLRLDQRHPPDVRLVFQNPALLASLSVRENVGFLLYRFSRLGEKEIAERVDQALQAVGLGGTADRMPGELSGGMQKRVSFARALIDDPTLASARTPLLLFDEPTAGLDPVACTRIEDLIVRTSRIVHASTLVVSHVMSTIDRCAERVALLYDGRFRWIGAVEDFRVSTNPYVVQFRSGSLQGPMQPAEN
ncbi:ABC transporter ATP-binding protein [Synechococcus sp. CS-1332]|uniref:ABC transporter ATP-binding protein n=1 Tax=Synechococcus sp. CS-1332 TaxID=2847972 RepID=UPI00223BA9DA|nr:ATP-binding cassette domain-containing protein [Synechococcus sp. CS-1332]MCT0208461.1 ATP-binding cassette domain-containing protein [Synechococcus sp. CS-1332]